MSFPVVLLYTRMPLSVHPTASRLPSGENRPHIASTPSSGVIVSVVGIAGARDTASGPAGPAISMEPSCKSSSGGGADRWASRPASSRASSGRDTFGCHPISSSKSPPRLSISSSESPLAFMYCMTDAALLRLSDELAAYASFSNDMYSLGDLLKHVRSNFERGAFLCVALTIPRALPGLRPPGPPVVRFTKSQVTPRAPGGDQVENF
eukprot:476081-Prorocentrum_minimum.AAC.4